MLQTFSPQCIHTQNGVIKIKLHNMYKMKQELSVLDKDTKSLIC